MRTKETLKARAADFLWAAGIENTFVPQVRPGHRSLDEYELMGHYEHWREDEFRAFQECAQRYAWRYEYLAFSLCTRQAVVRVL